MMEQTHTHLPDNTNEIALGPGEIICNKCNGSGYDPDYSQGAYFRPPCLKCQGEKKLDWISAATGVAPKEGLCGSSSWAANHTHSYNGTRGYGNLTIGSLTPPKLVITDDDYLEINGKSIKQYVEEIVATKVAKEIDRQIVETLSVQKEQILNTKRRKFFDNRIFSKLMFYCNFKQRFKSKKDKNII